MNTENTDRDLAERLAALPREIPPMRDPWAQIDERISADGSRGQASSQQVSQASRPPRGLRFLAMAASLALVFVMGWMLGQQNTVNTMPELAESPGDGSPQSLQAALATSEAEYQAAVREFMPIGDARSELSTRTVFEIEKGWAILKATEDSLQAALEDDPDNEFLVQQLMDLRERQLDFLQQLADLDQIERRLTI